MNLVDVRHGLGAPAFTRGVDGVIHRLSDGQVTKCGRVLELAEPIPALPDELADGALCARCWPRRSSDIAAGDA